MTRQPELIEPTPGVPEPGPWRAVPPPEALLERLAFPRENGSDALDAAHDVLDSALGTAGVTTQSIDFPCQAHRAEMAASVLVVVACLLAMGVWRRSRRAVVTGMLLVAVAVAVGVGWMDGLLPSTTERVLVAHVEPRTSATHQILLTAHYDTKTEPLDHTGRSVLFGAAALAGGIALTLGLRHRPSYRPAGLVAAALAAAVAAQLGLGRHLGSRSRGVLDDGGACVLLCELAATYARTPLQHTRLTCVWFAGEEVGAQGSAALAAALAHEDLVACVNLEGIGAGTDLVVSRYEMRHGRVYRASDTVRARLAQAGGRALRELPWPLWTDAGPLLAAGIPALTLLTLPPDSQVIRGLHGGHDTLARFDPRGYAHARALLQRTVAAADVP